MPNAAPLSRLTLPASITLPLCGYPLAPALPPAPCPLQLVTGPVAPLTIHGVACWFGECISARHGSTPRGHGMAVPDPLLLPATNGLLRRPSHVHSTPTPPLPQSDVFRGDPLPRAS